MKKQVQGLFLAEYVGELSYLFLELAYYKSGAELEFNYAEVPSGWSFIFKEIEGQFANIDLKTPEGTYRVRLESIPRENPLPSQGDWRWDISNIQVDKSY